MFEPIYFGVTKKKTRKIDQGDKKDVVQSSISNEPKMSSKSSQTYDQKLAKFPHVKLEEKSTQTNVREHCECFIQCFGPHSCYFVSRLEYLEGKLRRLEERLTEEKM